MSGEGVAYCASSMRNGVRRHKGDDRIQISATMFGMRLMRP
jgi:hypothetical protein